MKKLLLFLLLINFYNTLFSQENDLTQDSWFLEKIIIDDETIINPRHHSTYSYAWFTSNRMYSYMCESGGVVSDYVFTDTDGEIIFQNTNLYPGDCGNEESENFQNAYFEFFPEPEITCNYLLTDENGIKTLTFINSDGNELIYSNNYLTPVPDEMSGRWYLRELIINNETHTAPNDDEVSSIPIDFNSNYFITSVCAPFEGTVEFKLETSQFYIFDVAEYMMECNPFNGNDSYQDMYFGFFWNNYYEYFNYEISDNTDGSKTLIISDANGNQAIYGNTLLSTEELTKNKISIYPNPVKEKLTIENNDSKISKIQILDANGKLVLNQKINSAKTEINFAPYPKGIYFIKFESDGKIIKTEKTIKN